MYGQWPGFSRLGRLQMLPSLTRQNIVIPAGGSFDLEPGGISTKGFIEYCRLCGWALALAHAKSGDAAVLSGYIGKSSEFEDAIARFSAGYAEQTVQDHATMAAAARDGKIKVAEGTGR